ncbi:MAG: hypothetical protein ACJ74O_19630 [Frankiaceae bacterium]
MRPVPAAVRIRSAAVGCLAVASAAATYAGWGRPGWYAIGLLAIVVAVSEIATVYLSFGRQQWAMSLTESAVGAALVLDPGAWTVVAVMLGVLAAQAFRHRPRLKVEFNVAQFAASTAAAAATAIAVGGGVLGGLAGMAVFWAVNYVAVAVAISMTTTQRLASVLTSAGPLNLLSSVGNTSIGLLAAWLALHGPFGLLALVVPLGLLWVSYDQQTQQAFEARLFAELAMGQERVAGRSTDVSARVVLSAAARLFGGDAEIVIFDGDTPVHYVGDEHRVTRRVAVADTFDEPWVLRALGSRGLVSGVQDGRPYCSAVLGERDHPLAVMIARRPAGAPPFLRREQALAAVMVRQAQSWLSVAELTASRDQALSRAELAGETARALGDLGAHTWPALLTLRESAARLARLASLPEGPDPVGEIVDELHSAERAVASLLGAIAIAADPDLAEIESGHAVPAVPLTGPVADGDDGWTTTGVLEAALEGSFDRAEVGAQP